MIEEKEVPVYKIIKAKIKNDQLSADYEEIFRDGNYTNKVSKSSDQYIHGDLARSFDFLKPHLVAICELPEASKVDIKDPSDYDLDGRLKAYTVTGYSKGGTDESAGVTITGQKILASGQILNITTPFTQFEDEMGDEYTYGGELKLAIDRCDYEVDAYLFEQKFGLKQTTIDFDIPSESGINGTDEAPKKSGRGRKKKITMEITAHHADEPEEF
jgi:hypothetical protein